MTSRLPFSLFVSSQKILEENGRGALHWGAVDTCIPSADTLVHAPGGKKIAEIPPREEFQRGQTPQSFQYERICKQKEKLVERTLF